MDGLDVKMHMYFLPFSSMPMKGQRVNCFISDWWWCFSWRKKKHWKDY